MLPPPFSARAILGSFLTCLFPASPRNCVTNSYICARPEAPIGCPRANNPPLGLMGIFPSSSVAPLSTKGPPSPTGQNPICSII